jgi:signal transduction histidine kinase
MKTMRLRLTIWYMLFFIMLIIAMVVGVNLAVWQDRTDIQRMNNREPEDLEIWLKAHQGDISQVMDNIRVYSAIGVFATIIIAAIGGYFIAGIMLKTVDKVSSLAGRISFTNLQERLNYKGPNDEIKRLADTFDNMLVRLDGAVESQKQFIQDASHELRTPIAIALTNIEVLEMDEKATNQDYQKTMDILKLSLVRMNNINNSLLLLSEGTLSKSNWSEVDLISIITEVVNETTAQAEAENIKMEWSPPASALRVNGDAMYLKQAIINLVDNAIKYNQAGGLVKLAAQVESESFIIEIADSGIGISAEDLPRIFDRFFRVDKSRSRKRGGSGLGLAIVKKIVEDHGGTITVSSILGHGSSFHLSFPRYSAS